MNEITKRGFIYAFTGHPYQEEPMPPDELIKRLDVMLTSLKADIASGDKRLPVGASNALRGFVIRLCQAYGDREVAERVDELIGITSEITGI